MATKKDQKATPGGLPKKEADRYFDAMIENQKILNDAMDTARQRGVRLGEEFSKRFSEGQIQALEMARKVSEDPSSYFKIAMEATSSAQSNALEFLRAMYREQQDESDQMRETMSALVESSQQAAKAAADLARAWTPANPFADAMQKAYESATEAN